MNYNYPIKKQKIEQDIDALESTVLKFGDDWPGVFISTEYAKDFCIHLNDSYVNKDYEELRAILEEFCQLMDSSNVQKLDEKNMISLNAHYERVETGHIEFKNGKKGYFFRGDRSFLMKMALKNSLSGNEDESYSHIPFLINESKHWSKEC